MYHKLNDALPRYLVQVFHFNFNFNFNFDFDFDFDADFSFDADVDVDVGVKPFMLLVVFSSFFSIAIQI